MSGTNLGSRIVASSQQHTIIGCASELAVSNHIIMSRNTVNTLVLPQIPDFTAVILRPSSQMITVWSEVTTQD